MLLEQADTAPAASPRREFRRRNSRPRAPRSGRSATRRGVSGATVPSDLGMNTGTRVGEGGEGCTASPRTTEGAQRRDGECPAVAAEVHAGRRPSRPKAVTMFSRMSNAATRIGSKSTSCGVAGRARPAGERRDTTRSTGRPRTRSRRPARSTASSTSDPYTWPCESVPLARSKELAEAGVGSGELAREVERGPVDARRARRTPSTHTTTAMHDRHHDGHRSCAPPRPVAGHHDHAVGVYQSGYRPSAASPGSSRHAQRTPHVVEGLVHVHPEVPESAKACRPPVSSPRSHATKNLPRIEAARGGAGNLASSMPRCQLMITGRMCP